MNSGPPPGMFHVDMTGMSGKSMRPRRDLPDGAWDCHAHVFGPFDRFPVLPGGAYVPPLASAEEFVGMLDQMGFHNGVVVQPAAYGYDNAALLEALGAYSDRLRGVAVVDPAITQSELIALREAGVRGVRITEPVGGRPPMGSQLLRLEHLDVLAPKLATAGLHVQLWADASAIVAAGERLLAAGVPIVLDHMAQLDVAAGVTGDDFQALLTLTQSDRIWIKVPGLRVTKKKPSMADVRPFFEILATTAADRLLWGSDWPFIALGLELPAPGELVDVLSDWAGASLARILVDNPQRLYA